MKRCLLALGLLAVTTSSEAGRTSSPPRDPSRSIVKLYVTRVLRDVNAPWRPGWNWGVTGSGAWIEGGRILTAAHVVDDQTFVQVRANGTARKFPARVTFVSHVADLALLEVDDPAFREGLVPLELGGLPAVRDRVAAYGFPNGGETLSITEGVVARVENGLYVHSRESFLEIQMDAAIAPGSSGGPLLRDGRVVGVAMQGFKESTIGCAVPMPMVRQFLDDVADGTLDGVPELGLSWQKLENVALRSSLRVPPGRGGVLVTSAEPPASSALQAGDVLLSVGGRDVADDGTVELRPGERTNFGLATDVLQLRSPVDVRYLRDGSEHTATLRLERAQGEGHLVPRVFERNADYYFFGGLAFVALTRNLLDATKGAPAPVAALAERPQLRPGQEVVVLLNVLSADVNSGYDDRTWEVVDAVDGSDVRSLADLVRRVERPDGGAFVVFGLGEGRRVTVDRARALATRAEVLARYEVPSDRSPRLAALLKEKPAGDAPTPAALAAIGGGQP